MRLKIVIVFALFVPFCCFLVLQSTRGGKDHGARRARLDNPVVKVHEEDLEYEERRRRIKQVCEKYDIRMKEEFSGGSFMLDSRNKMAFCRNGKAGTSTWLRLFLDLSPFSNVLIDRLGLELTPKQLHDEVPKLFHHNLTTPHMFNSFIRDNNILTFSFVRHPFDRLVSAFEDKILGKHKLSQEEMQSHEDSSLRHAHYNELGETLQRSFPRFIDYVMKEYFECQNLKHSTCLMDVHWKRFHDRCSYCSVHYDIIGKMETFEKDKNYILSKQNLTEKQAVHLRLNSVLHDQMRTQTYFSQLGSKTKKLLYHIYKLDFEMFGYDASLYMT